VLRAFKNTRLLRNGCCGLNDIGNEILFGINISPPLNNDRWIGLGGPTAWPPRSPDFTPMDFFLWGHIKALIYKSPVDSEEDLISF
jgi:hypothetical protein